MSTMISDRYEVIRPLGRGGFAHTLLARDTKLGRQVALKLLHPHTAKDWKAYELFEREAQVMKELRHPGIPVIHLALEAEYEGQPAAVLVMEYIAGETLADVIAQKRHLELEDVMTLLVEMLGLLDYLHTRVPPVLHRDIKPANIIVRPGGAPALVDFGAVRNVFRNPDEPGSTMVGTYGYMPYEQTMGQASPSSDLYALAATFLHLLTGRPPSDFMAEDAQIEVPATLPHGERLRDVLTRMLAPRPGDRFPSARDVRSALLGGAASGTAMVRIEASSTALALPPAPRAVTPELRQRARTTAYSMWEVMDSDGEPGVRPGIFDWAALLFFCTITAGILPITMFSRARARRRRVKDFLRHGVPAVATILEMTVQKIEFDAKLVAVKFAFEVDGRRRVATDRVLPAMAATWEVGGPLHILYRPDQEYAGVIVAGA